MNGSHPHSARKGSYSLKAIIHDVEQREGRNFSGPEVMPLHPGPRPPLRPIAAKGSFSLSRIIQEVAEREGCPVEAPEVQISINHHECPRHPRATRQVTLEGNRVAPVVTPLDSFARRGACRAQKDHPAGTGPEPGFVQNGNDRLGPEESTRPQRQPSCGTPAVLSLLPELPRLNDETFLMLYLDASREFERRFGADGWHDKVLTIAARGR